MFWEDFKRNAVRCTSCVCDYQHVVPVSGEPTQVFEQLRRFTVTRAGGRSITACTCAGLTCCQ
eukprot:4818482-Amphidinium_carterae.1